MTLLTMHDVSRRSGLSAPTLRYYEEFGLLGPIGREERSGHRRWRKKQVASRRELDLRR